MLLFLINGIKIDNIIFETLKNELLKIYTFVNLNLLYV